MAKKTPNYDQEQVNANMEKMFDLPKTPTVQERMKNIIRTEKSVDKESEATEKQSEKPKVKASGRGGARKNSGRKKGSIQKLSGASILDAIAQIDMPFEEGLALDYKRARDEGDLHVIQRYQTMILAKVVADKSEVDVTSNGQTLGVAFNFPTTELQEWNDGPTTH